MLAIGLMSGTSLDGVDVALIDTDGERVAAFGPTGYRAYADGERTLLREALAAAVALTDRRARPGALAEAEALITRAHAEAVEDFLAGNGIARSDIGIVGFHGQTVLHRPEDRLTVQIGDGVALARRIGIDVAFDMRAADVAAGGQGAPIVPVYHRALAGMASLARPLVVVNVGGVANVTWLDDGSDPVACDVGPGNALLDDFMRTRTGIARDEDGATAARGRADMAVVGRVVAEPFFAAPPPKSLDRNAFAHVDASRLSTEDGAATLTALTVEGIARIVPLLPAPPRTFVIAGGGAHNPTLMKLLADRLVPARVTTADAVGWSADALEAQAFAYLAVRSLKGLPLTFPTTTGVPRPMTGGVIARAVTAG